MFDPAAISRPVAPPIVIVDTCKGGLPKHGIPGQSSVSSLS